MGMKNFIKDVATSLVKDVIQEIVGIIFNMIVRPNFMGYMDKKVPYGHTIGFAA